MCRAGHVRRKGVHEFRSDEERRQREALYPDAVPDHARREVPRGHPYKASSRALNSLVRAAQKKFGPVLPRAKAILLWRKLASARKLWKAQKYTNALACYRTVALAKKVNPNLPIVAELKTDEEAIDEHGAKPLKEAEALREKGEVVKAEGLLRKIQGTYKGFEPAKKAKELLDQIHGKGKKQTQTPDE